MTERTHETGTLDIDFEFTGHDKLRFKQGERIIARFEVVEAEDSALHLAAKTERSRR
jgi:hypothetical protein